LFAGGPVIENIMTKDPNGSAGAVFAQTVKKLLNGAPDGRIGVHS
jgi:hypothetical protein